MLRAFLLVSLTAFAANLAAAEADLSDDELKATYEAAKVAHAARIKSLAKAASQGDTNARKALTKLRQAKVALPLVQWKEGSFGYLNHAYYFRKIDENTASIKVSATATSDSIPTTIKGLDTKGRSPGEYLDDVAVIVESMESESGGGVVPVYRVIDLKPYDEKYGKLK